MPDSRFPFSNFQACEVVLDDLPYPSVEHAYQASKTLDRSERAWIQQAKSAAEAKKKGRKLILRPEWEQVKFMIMDNLLHQKFAPDTDFAKQLMAFEGEIVEYTTWHDQIWGVCTCPEHKGEGQNNLGLLLMKIRDELNSPSNMGWSTQEHSVESEQA